MRSSNTPTPKPWVRGVTLALLGFAAATHAEATVLQVTGTAAHCGNFGLNVQVNTADPGYVQDNTPSTESSYVVRYWFNLESLTVPSTFEMFQGFTDDGAATKVLSVEVTAAKGLQARYWSGGSLSSASAITGSVATGWHSLELAWTVAAGSSGSLTATVDGGSVQNVSGGIDSSGGTVGAVRWGVPSGSGGSGYLLLDDFESRRTGPIGLGTTASCQPQIGGPEPKGFFALTPCRVYDSRTASSPLQSGNSRVISITDTASPAPQVACGVPSTAKAVAINVVAITPLANGFMQVWPDATTAPSTSFMNFRQSKTRANNGFAVVNGGKILVLPTMPSSPGATTHFAVDVTGYFQ